MLFAVVATGAGLSVPAAADAVGTSDAGVVPVMMNDAGPGGNATCGTIGSSVSLTSSDRLDWQRGRFNGELPVGLAVVVTDDTAVSWSSTFPISAVIVKGGNASNVYLYSPTRLSDGELVPPVNASGGSAELSNLTFCWDPNTPPPPDDLELLCLRAATAADVGPITSVVGPMEIRSGSFVASTVPSDVVLTFDAAEHVSFTAPFPVVMAVMRSSPVSVHRIDPAATTGSVPFASDPGSGDMVLCGLAAETAVQASCAMVKATAEVGPASIRADAVVTDAVPPVIKKLEVQEDAVEFEAVLPVVGVLVTASPTVLHAFDEPVRTAAIPLVVDSTTDVDLEFCVRAISISTTDDPGQDAVAVIVADPSSIASGGGPSRRVELALFAVHAVSLVGARVLRLRSRRS